MTAPTMPLRTPGMPALDGTAFAALTAPPSPQDISAEGQGQTQEAIALLEQEIKQRQEDDADARQKALKAIYGEGFPLALDKSEPDDADWTRWADDR